jgi:uncharacterized protein YecT (DUF1311 family)
MKAALACACLALTLGCRRGGEPTTTQRQMDTDAQAAFHQADAQLQAIYSSIGPRLDDDDRARLAAAERAWTAYRDSNCAAEQALYEGGSIAPQIQFACLAKLTDDRIGELKRVYDEQLGRQ